MSAASNSASSSPHTASTATPRFPNPTHAAAWKQLSALASTDCGAWQPPLLTGAGLTLDISRQRLDTPRFAGLLALLEAQQFNACREAFLRGDAINLTEGRAVLHFALRDATNGFHSGIADGVATERARLAKLATALRRGQMRSIADHAYTDAIIIGIGGSALGPELACTALSRAGAAEVSGESAINVHFVANVDGAAMDDVTAQLDPARTLVVVISKTFTTEETLANAAAAREWMTARIGAEAFAVQSVAITARPEEAARQGYAAERTLRFWDSVGGRFSLWSTVGLPVALAYGAQTFDALLDGAHAMDRHFADAPAGENLPVVLALLGVWNRNFQSLTGHVVLPYAQRLALLPKHLQQLEMESTGKSVDLNGEQVSYPTCPSLFGEAGTNGQHSFHQLLHQGTDQHAMDVVIVKEPEAHARTPHVKLLANAFAQADAWWSGRSFDDAYAALSGIADEAERRRQAMHRVHAGKRPVTLIELPRLDAFHLGALIACYEHKVFTQGVLWNINAFDQFGVELGKVIARKIEPRIDAALRDAGDGKSLLAALQGDSNV